jgi:hypothetical protein
MMFNEIVKAMARDFQEEETEAIKALIEIAGVEVDERNLAQTRENLDKKGFTIQVFREKNLETIFTLSLKGEFVAGAIVSLNFELGQIKRTMIPHFNDLDEKFHKFIKGV